MAEANHYSGEPLFCTTNKKYEIIPLRHLYETSHGIGPADRSTTIIAWQNRRFSGVTANHVLEKAWQQADRARDRSEEVKPERRVVTQQNYEDTLAAARKRMAELKKKEGAEAVDYW